MSHQMIDRKYIGQILPVRVATIEAGQLKAFAKAIGETDPIYGDQNAARRAGHPALPAPPTFAFSVTFADPIEKGFDFAELGIHDGNILHGEQGFEYFLPIYAGDTITIVGRIADIYEKKGGALGFVVTESDAFNQRGELCVRLRAITVVRNGGDGA